MFHNRIVMCINSVLDRIILSFGHEHDNMEEYLNVLGT